MIFLLLLSSIFYQQGFGHISPLTVLLIVFTIYFIFKYKINSINRDLFLVLILPFFIGFLSLLFSLIFSEIPRVAPGVLLLTFTHQLFYALTTVIIFNHVSVKYTKSYIYIALILFAFAILQTIQYSFLGLDPFHLESTHDSFKGFMGGALNYDYFGYSFRATSLFSEPGDFGIFIIPICLFALWSFEKKYQKLFVLFVLCASFLINKSLTGPLALLVAFATINWKRILHAKIFIGLLLLALILYSIFSDRILVVFDMNDPSVNMRLSGIYAAYNELSANIYSYFFGFGYGSGSKIDLGVGDMSIKSDYVKILFESGIVGLLLYLLYIFYILRKFRHNQKFLFIFIYFLALGLLADTTALVFKYIFIAIPLIKDFRK